MNPIFVSLLLAPILGQLTVPEARLQAQETPGTIVMTLAWIADAEPPNRYVFVLDGALAFQTVEGLKRHLATRPAGTTVSWAPGCLRMGDEPLLNSQEAMQAFEDFCRTAGLRFVLHPSG